MARKIFVNLPVRDLPKSIEFYRAIGFTLNPQFTDETAACMVLSEEIYVMLLTHPKFAGFTSNTIADATQTTEVINALSCDDRPAVDATAEKAVAAGGRQHRDPMDHGFMYLRSFQDLDGHVWEIFWMDPAAVPQG